MGWFGFWFGSRKWCGLVWVLVWFSQMVWVGLGFGVGLANGLGWFGFWFLKFISIYLVIHISKYF